VSPILPPDILAAHEFCSASASLWVWIAASTSAFSERTAWASNFAGGSIATSDSSWNRWFGTMSRKRAGGVVEAAAMADAELFVDGDLDMVDMIAIPDRLEHAVGEAQHQDVLDGFLAEVMIDPVDLLLVDEFQQLVVQRLGRSEVGSERLFDHQPPPRAVFPSACRRGRAAWLIGGRRWAASPDRTGGCRRSARPRACRAARAWLSNEAGSFGSASMQVTHSSRRLAIASSTGRVANWCSPSSGCRQFLARHALAGDADHAEFLRQQIVRREIIERRDHQPVGRSPVTPKITKEQGSGFFCLA
jgi:hypothetical protein